MVPLGEKRTGFTADPDARIRVIILQTAECKVGLRLRADAAFRLGAQGLWCTVQVEGTGYYLLVGKPAAAAATCASPSAALAARSAWRPPAAWRGRRTQPPAAAAPRPCSSDTCARGRRSGLSRGSRIHFASRGVKKAEVGSRCGICFRWFSKCLVLACQLDLGRR